MSHLLFHVLIRFAFYPVFYWIGFAAVKGLTWGRTIIMPYSELGAEEGAAWWEFRIRRWGYKEWRPETMILAGAFLLLILVGGYSIVRYGL